MAYHFVREGCAVDEWRTAYLHTLLNVSDFRLYEKNALRVEALALFQNVASPHLVWRQGQHWDAE